MQSAKTWSLRLRQRNGDAECDGFLRTILFSPTAAREIHVSWSPHAEVVASFAWTITLLLCGRFP